MSATYAISFYIEGSPTGMELYHFIGDQYAFSWYVRACSTVDWVGIHRKCHATLSSKDTGEMLSTYSSP